MSETNCESGNGTGAAGDPPVWCWHDLSTSDVDGALAFYTALFGWSVQAVPMGNMTYQMLSVGEFGIGGVVPLDPSNPAPPHWIGYVATDDVDGTAVKAAQNGGGVLVPPQDIPGIGRFAVVADPAVAAFALYKSAGEMGPAPPVGTPGVFCWNELMTTDVPGAKAFYEAVLGWTSQDMDMGEAGTYTMFSKPGRQTEGDCGGMMQRPPDAPHPPFWLGYVCVADIDASWAKVDDLGGMQFVPPTDIPGIGRFAVVADPQGATFALYQGGGG